MAVSRDAIVAAALEILDSYGLADLSMRRIADALGVQAATIYWHYANKQTLLAGVSDVILAEQLAPESTDVVGGLAEWARDLRAVLLAHRDAAELVAATLAVGLGERVPDQSAVELLLGAGWSGDDAERATRAMTHFVLGHVMTEQTRQNLLLLGVLEPGSETLDELGFDVGLSMLTDGALARQVG